MKCRRFISSVLIIIFCLTLSVSADMSEVVNETEVFERITIDEYPELFTQELHSLEPSEELPFTFTPTTYKDGQAVITVSSNEFKDFELSISLYGEQYEKEETHIDVSGNTFMVEVNRDYTFYIRSEIGDTIYNYVGIITPAAFSSRDFRHDVVIKTKNVDSFVKNKSDIPNADSEFSREDLETLRGAGTIVESEPNDYFYQANRIYDDYDVFGRILPQYESDWFVVSFSSAGNANFWLGEIPSGFDYDLFLYDQDGTTKLAQSTGSGSYELFAYNVLPYRNYYIQVKGQYGSSNILFYWLRAKNYPATPPPQPPTPVGDQYEPNDTPATATPVSTGYRFANIHIQTDVDYYRLYINGNSTVNITLDNIPYGCDYDLKLFNSTGYGEMDASTFGGNIPEEIIGALASGTYYIKVYSYQGASTSNYRLGVTITQNQQYGTLTYNGNRNTGGAVPQAQSFVLGSPVTIQGNIGDLRREGFGFVGWNTNILGTGTDYAAWSQYYFTQPSVTLYAKWRGTNFWTGGLSSASNLKYNHNATTTEWNKYIYPAINAWTNAIAQVNISATSAPTPDIRILFIYNSFTPGVYGTTYPYARDFYGNDYSILEANGNLDHTIMSWSRCRIEIYENIMQNENFTDSKKVANMMHELGHSLSLSHPEYTHYELSIMRQIAQPGFQQSYTLQDCDIINLRTKWGN